MKEIMIIDPGLHADNCKIMNKTYQKLNDFFESANTCRTSSEWYLKYIFSELTIKYLIFYNMNAKGEKLDEYHQFPDWSCWESFYESIGAIEDEDDQFYYRDSIFSYNRGDFKKLIKIIPYLLIESHFFCPCCNKFDNYFLYNFDAPTTVAYFTCYNEKAVFKDATEQLKHFEVNGNIKNPSINDRVHRFHQVFHVWLTFYKHCKNLMSKTNKL